MPHLICPLYLVVEQAADGQWLAASYDLELAGEGATEFEALDDLRKQVVDLHGALVDMKSDLPADLAGKLRFLEGLTG